MKKVRLKLKQGGDPWKFVIYDSVESAYYLNESDVKDVDSNEDFSKIISLDKDDLIEVEWLGSEWSYDLDSKTKSMKAKLQYDKFDNVLVGKISQSKIIEKCRVIEIYIGWIKGGTIKWSQSTQKGVRITRVNSVIDSKVDFSSLFRTKREEEEKETGVSSAVPEIVN